MSLATALDEPVVLQFFAAKLELPGYTARFFMGRGQITLNGETYTGTGVPGEDGVFGSMEAIEGSVGNEAPRLRLTLAGLNNNLFLEARDYLAQGSRVSIYDCVIDRETLTPVADPELAFFGFLDTAEIEIGDSTAITLDVASAWEWLFFADDTARRTDRFHQIVWPGERGFQYVPDASRQLPWGALDDARPTYTGGGATTNGPLVSPRSPFSGVPVF